VCVCVCVCVCWGGQWTDSQLGLPLCEAVYNSRMWDSQKETPNRTSCGFKIPRCQELKIAATGPQPTQRWQERGMLTVEAGGWPCLRFQPPALWVPSCLGCKASYVLVADRRPLFGQNDILGCCSAS
jgi:hypothetical protein